MTSPLEIALQIAGPAAQFHTEAERVMARAIAEIDRAINEDCYGDSVGKVETILNAETASDA